MISTLKEKFNSKIPTIGSWISIPSNLMVEVYAYAGFDWLAIDLEHSTISLNMMEDMIRVMQLGGTPALVRLTSNNEDQIKRVMDAGANGIIVPMVNSKHDIEKAIKATRYPPHGNRGVGLARAQRFGNNFKKYLEWQKNNIVVIAQIENKKALDSLDDIFSTDMLDGFMIGPYDLSCSMNIPGDFDNLKYKEAIKFIIEAGKKNDCLSGIHIIEPDEALINEAINNEFKMIAYGVDFKIINKTIQSGIKTFKNLNK